MLKRNGDGKAHIDRVEVYNLLIKVAVGAIALFGLYITITGTIRADGVTAADKIEQKIMTTSAVLNDKIEKETGELGAQIQDIQSRLDENIKMDATDHSTFKAKIERNVADIKTLGERSGP